MRKRMLFGTSCILFMAIVLVSNVSLAAYPEKPVTLVCVWGAGGANDSIARNIAETMKKYFPQPMVVVNREGGAGTVGTSEVLRARPDGYVIGSTTMTSLATEPHLAKLPYNTPDDYIPIALVGRQAFALLVHKDIPVKTVKEFVEYVKANPGKVRLGTGGTAHITHLLMEQLNAKAQLDLMDVPFKGGGEKMTALIGKHIESSIATLFEVLPQARAGNVRVLGLCDEKRSPLLPEIPTMRETGYDITMTTYTILIGPKALPLDIVSKIQDAFKRVCQDPNFLKFMDAQGVTVAYEGTEEVRRRLWKDYRANKEVLERLGLIKK